MDNLTVANSWRSQKYVEKFNSLISQLKQTLYYENVITNLSFISFIYNIDHFFMIALKYKCRYCKNIIIFNFNLNI